MTDTGFNLAEAAASRGVHKRTVRRWVRTGRLEARIDDAGHYHIDPETLHRMPLTGGEVARLVGVHLRTVNRWCLRGWIVGASRGPKDWWIPAGQVRTCRRLARGDRRGVVSVRRGQ